ncbi:MAG: hypothetical protein Q9177_004537 [Variospora cf. flavescens]
MSTLFARACPQKQSSVSSSPLAGLEFSAAFSAATTFALFKTYGFPSISSLLAKTNQLAGPALRLLEWGTRLEKPPPFDYHIFSLCMHILRLVLRHLFLPRFRYLKRRSKRSLAIGTIICLHHTHAYSWYIRPTFNKQLRREVLLRDAGSSISDGLLNGELDLVGLVGNAMDEMEAEATTL